MVKKMLTVKKKPMGNGYDHFICPKCGHDNPIVFSSWSMQVLADTADKLSCELCDETLSIVGIEK